MTISPQPAPSAPPKITSLQRINMDSKNLLARLMASENLVVEHDPDAHTAHFEMTTRRLVLPCWTGITDDIYDMLVAHEVGHALFTPPGDAYEAAAKSIGPNNPDIAAQYLNVVEDARIEKLIKRKYPGIIINFRRAYIELFDSSFFGDLTRLANPETPLIDKINLRGKVGVHAQAIIPMDTVEELWFFEVMATETWDEVVDLTRRLFIAAAMDKLPPPASVQVSGGVVSGGGGGPKTLDDAMDTNSEAKTERESFPVAPASQTVGVAAKGMEKFVDTKASALVYLEYPKNVDVSQMIVDYKEVRQHLSRLTVPDGILNEFRKVNMRYVDAMAKTFHVRQAADEQQRTMIRRSGVLDIRKIVHYQTQEDIFRRNSNVRQGKNHGLVVYLDWSGSMSDILGSTIRQLATLVLFAKKIGIPFEVYAFSDQEQPNAAPYPKNNRKNEIDFHRITLLNLLSSRMRGSEFTDMMERLLALANWYETPQPYGSDAPFAPCLNLGGTPLNKTLVLARYVNGEFLKKTGVQILNTIVMTDGEDTASITTQGGTNTWGGHRVFRDGETKAQTLSLDNETQNKALCSILRQSTETNLVGMYLAGSDVKNALTHLANVERGSTELNRLMSHFREYRFAEIDCPGYDTFFVIPGKQLEEALNKRDEKKEQRITKGRLAAAFIKERAAERSKQVVMDRFIDMITAHNCTDRSRRMIAKQRQVK